MSIKRRVDNLNALIISLVLGTLGAILLLSILGKGVVVSAAQGETMHDDSTHETPDFQTTLVTPTVNKTVVPTNPDTGGVVSICFAISGISSWNLDVALVQDVSWSMHEPITVAEGVTTRLAASQAAADAFVSVLSRTDRVAIVSYSVSAHLAQPLTTTKSVITETIYGLTTTEEMSGTNTGEGIWIAHKELISPTHPATGTVKTIILMSDGIADCFSGVCDETIPAILELAADYAKTQAMLAASDTIKIYTIGFSADAGEDLLREIAEIGHGKYFFVPDADVLETVYLAIAQELHSLTITDILTPGVETDCSQWPDDWCIVNPSGITTITWPISDSLLISDEPFCFTATVNLDPGYKGEINLPGSGICYQDSDGQTICDQFNKPKVVVGGRKITGSVFYDVNGNGLQEMGEAGVPDVAILTATEMTSATLFLPRTTTDENGAFVLRTSSEPAISVTIEIPSGYVATTPISEAIPAVTGPYSMSFGIRAEIYLPVIVKWYPLPSIVNGGFEDEEEDGWIGWNYGRGEGLAETVTSVEFYSGTHSALLGDPAYICQGGVPVGSAWMEQTLYVPNTQSPRLFFQYNFHTYDINWLLEEKFDSFDVTINGNLVFRKARTTGEYGCAPQDEYRPGWQRGEIDLGDYRGELITIRFENRNSPDGWFNTWTFVDDVRFIP